MAAKKTESRHIFGGGWFLASFARGRFILTGIVVVVTGCVLGLLGVMPTFRKSTYEPQADMTPGAELLFVYIGSSTCGPSNSPETRDAVREIRNELYALSHREGIKYAAVGIARDLDVKDGVAHLNDVGRWDELMTGRGWLNTGVLKYIYGDMPGRAATPQVVIVARVVDDNGTRSVSSERVLARLVGAREIEEWASVDAVLTAVQVREPLGEPVSRPAETGRRFPGRTDSR